MILLLPILLLGITMGCNAQTSNCFSVPLAYSNISSCSNGNCLVSITATSAMDANPNSVACHELKAVKLDNVTILEKEDYYLEIALNHCDYAVKYVGAGAELRIVDVKAAVSFDLINKDINNCNTVPRVYGSVQVCVLRYGVVTFKVAGITYSDTRRYAMVVGFDPVPRFAMFLMTAPVRHIAISLRDEVNATNTTSIISWDGKALESFKVFDSSDITLISQTGNNCADLTSSIISVDLEAPYDLIEIPKANVNSFGNSFGDKLFGAQYDANGNLAYNADHIAMYLVTKIISVDPASHTDIVVGTASYTGINNELYFENKRIAKDTIKNRFPDVSFIDTINDYVTNTMAAKNPSYTHIIPDPFVIQYTRTSDLKSILSIAGFIDQVNQVSYVIWGADSGGLKQCYTMNSVGVFDIPSWTDPLNTLIYARTCSNSLMQIHCNKTARAMYLTWSSSGGNEVVANTTSFCYINTHGYEDLVDVSKSILTNVVSASYYFHIRPESSSSITYALNTTREVVWITNKCCPTITGIKDNLDTGNLEINASSSCVAGTALIIEVGAISDEPKSISLSPLQQTYYYKRAFNTSGLQTIKLCCADNCIARRFKVSYFPYVPPIQDIPTVEHLGEDDVAAVDGIDRISTGSAIGDWFANAWKDVNKWLGTDFSSNFGATISILKYIGFAIMVVVGIILIALFVKYVAWPYTCFIYKIFMGSSKKISEKVMNVHSYVVNSTEMKEMPRRRKNVGSEIDYDKL